MSRDVYGTMLKNVPKTKSWDVMGTLTGHLHNEFLKHKHTSYFDRLMKDLLDTTKSTPIQSQQ